MKATRFLAAFLFLAAMSGFAYAGLEILAGPPMLRGYPPNQDALQAQNARALESRGEIVNGRDCCLAPNNQPMADEWAYRDARRVRNGPPEVCLALSGGGIRSAAFSIGVLKGLQETAQLKTVDAVSAVSGGAYATAWYLAQHFHHRTEYDAARAAGGVDAVGALRDRIDAMLFAAAPSPYQARFEGSFGLFTKPEYGLWATVSLFPGSVVNFFANGAFGWHANTTPGRHEYEQRLRKLFVADGRSEGDAGADINLAALGEFSKDVLPFFVINATAFIDDERHHHGASLENSIYEFNALQYGNSAFGRYRYLKEGDTTDSAAKSIGLARAASISGAALDGSSFIAGSAQRVFWSALNLDLGFYLDNPRIRGDKQFAAHMLPFPFYFFGKHYDHDAESTDIYVTDGGHSDNLGLFSLVRRRCGSVIVVDAEWDPGYEFDAYRTVKTALRKEIGVEMSVQRIDSLINSAGPRQNADGAGKLDMKGHDITGDTGWQTIAASPVMQGEICCLPYPGKRETIPVTYVKLAYHPDLTVLGPGHVTTKRSLDRFFEGRRRSRLDHHTGYFFPQDPTTDQDFTHEQYIHYRDLGYALTSSVRSIKP